MAAEFVGHGVFGWRCKPSWTPYFGVAGIDPATACRLMPWVGTHDVLLGVLGLVSPRPALLAWMTFWGFFTATLRPLAGEPVWEMVERAGNFGLPAAFLLLAWPRGDGHSGLGERFAAWWRPIRFAAPNLETLPRVSLVLRATTALLLVGHGALGAFCCKPLLASHYALLGWRPLAVGSAGWLLDPVQWIGGAEMALGVTLFSRPIPGLLLLAGCWKLFSESLYPLSGAPLWELVERGGSYAAPLGLWMLIRQNRPKEFS